MTARQPGGAPTPATAPDRHVIDPRTVLDYVHLTVTDLARVVDFYHHVLGLRVHRRQAGYAALGAGRHDLLRLTERPDAPRARRTSGLYHFCLLVEQRVELAQLLRRIAETGTPVQGLVDHHFSEAIYLPDPEGNGIELNWDRPRDQWPPVDTVIRQGNGPLDVAGLETLLADAPHPWPGLPTDTTVGHIHLHVGDLAAAERFYVDTLGFERRMAFPGQAIFVAAGGYHHHVAFNLWAGRDIAPPPPDAAGLRAFAIRLPDEAELGRVLDRLRAAGNPPVETPDGVLVHDPAQNAVVLRSGPGA
jgi:catechol 2,3-dioxygenase